MGAKWRGGDGEKTAEMGERCRRGVEKDGPNRQPGLFRRHYQDTADVDLVQKGGKEKKKGTTEVNEESWREAVR